jgi:hypothetical protein
MSDLTFILDSDETAVLELKLGQYMLGERGYTGQDGPPGPPGTLTPDDEATLQKAVTDSQASASAASGSATASAQSAASAANSAALAQSSGQAAATAAQNSANDAAASASSATGSASDATAKSVAAAASATASQASATAADASKTAAKTSETNSKTSETNSAASAAAAASSALSAGQAGFRNLLHNARFLMNTRYCASPYTATAGYQYTLDRWRICAQGETVSWASKGNGTYWEITCPASGWETVIDNVDVQGGTYVFSWQGTATCNVGFGGVGHAIAKNGTLDIPAGTSAIRVQFFSGTLSLPQMELGTIPTVFEWIPYMVEASRCGAYARVITIDHESQNNGQQNSIWTQTFPYMRKVPTNAGLIRGSNPSYGGATAAPPTFAIRQDAITCTVPMTAAGGTWYVVGYQLLLSADL